MRSPRRSWRARAQVKASLLIPLESTDSRCEQLARQWQVLGRVIPTAETVAKVNVVTTADICVAASRIFRAAPTVATLGPVEQVPGLAERLAA